MINLNKDFLSQVMRASLFGNNSAHIHFYNGAYPGDQAIENVLNGTKYPVSAIFSELSAAGCTLAGLMSYSSSISAEIETSSFDFNLASRAEELEVINTNPVAFALIVLADSATTHAAAKTHSYNANQVIVASVGSLGANKDIEIKDGHFLVDTVYKIDDFKLNISS